MRLLKFNESSKIRMHKKGEIYLHINYDKQFSKKTIYELLQSIDIEVLGIDNNQILIKTPIGKEMETGKFIIDKLPFIFEDYYRRDINVEYIFNEISGISKDVQNLEDYVGGISISDEFNKDIDSIINRLEKLKVK